METGKDRNTAGRLVVECTDPAESTQVASEDAGIAEEVRKFRAAIVGEWAADYARRRRAQGRNDPSGAFADLRRWTRAHLASPPAAPTEPADPSDPPAPDTEEEAA
jgi:hypothetical protein